MGFSLLMACLALLAAPPAWALDPILQRYSQQKSRDALLFEAVQTEALVQPDLTELGYQNAERWKSIADTYRDLGIMRPGSVPELQIFRRDDGGGPRWLE